MPLTDTEAARIGRAVTDGGERGGRNGTGASKRRTTAHYRRISKLAHAAKKRKRTPAQTAALRQNARRSK
jgi:hypothetical protein